MLHRPDDHHQVHNVNSFSVSDYKKHLPNYGASTHSPKRFIFESGEREREGERAVAEAEELPNSLKRTAPTKLIVSEAPFSPCTAIVAERSR